MLWKKIIDIVNNPHVWKNDNFTLACTVSELVKEEYALVLENEGMEDLATTIRAL